MVQTDRQATDDKIIRRKAIKTHSKYVMLTTFTLQRWLRKHVSVLRDTYIACIVTFLFVNILPHCTNESLYKIFKLRALRMSSCYSK